MIPKGSFSDVGSSAVSFLSKDTEKPPLVNSIIADTMFLFHAATDMQLAANMTTAQQTAGRNFFYYSNRFSVLDFFLFNTGIQF